MSSLPCISILYRLLTCRLFSDFKPERLIYRLPESQAKYDYYFLKSYKHTNLITKQRRCFVSEQLHSSLSIV